MKLPNKVTSYKESTISRFPIILKCLKTKDHTLISLYNEVKDKMSIREYIDALDCLFILDKITLKEGIIHYVNRNIL